MANAKMLVDLNRADDEHMIPRGSVLPLDRPGLVVLPCGSRATVLASDYTETDEALTPAPQRRRPCNRCKGTGKVPRPVQGHGGVTCVVCGGDGLRRSRVGFH